MKDKRTQLYEFFKYCGHCKEYDLHNTFLKIKKITTVCCNCGRGKTMKVS